MSTMTELTYRGHRIVVVRVGIFLTLIEYRDLFKNLPRGLVPGEATSRQFRVLTSTLDQENDICLANNPDHT